MRQIIISAH